MIPLADIIYLYYSVNHYQIIPLCYEQRGVNCQSRRPELKKSEIYLWLCLIHVVYNFELSEPQVFHM